VCDLEQTFFGRSLCNHLGIPQQIVSYLLCKGIFALSFEDLHVPTKIVKQNLESPTAQRIKILAKVKGMYPLYVVKYTISFNLKTHLLVMLPITTIVPGGYTGDSLCGVVTPYASTSAMWRASVAKSNIWLALRCSRGISLKYKIKKLVNYKFKKIRLPKNCKTFV
jgi:hypothetical protein